MRRYIYELADWPNFYWHDTQLLRAEIARCSCSPEEIWLKLALLDIHRGRSIV